jgi:NTP pyrophosphatase (non-canonical NTP hydrolase)
MISHKIDFGRSKLSKKEESELIGHVLPVVEQLSWFDKLISFISKEKNGEHVLLFLLSELNAVDRYVMCKISKEECSLIVDSKISFRELILKNGKFIVDVDECLRILRAWQCNPELISKDALPDEDLVFMPVRIVPSQDPRVVPFQDQDIKSWIERSYSLAKEKGWHDKPTSEADFPARLMLIVGELSEALEEYRKDSDVNKYYYGDSGKPEGIKFEIADAAIRIFDLCGHYKIDLQGAINEKHEFNKTRPYRHGNKTI